MVTNLSTDSKVLFRPEWGSDNEWPGVDDDDDGNDGDDDDDGDYDELVNLFKSPIQTWVSEWYWLARNGSLLWE